MNKFLHVLGVIAVSVGGLAAVPGLLPFASVIAPVALGVGTLSAYFASNKISLANAPAAALEAATVAKQVQAALTKGNPNYGK